MSLVHTVRTKKTLKQHQSGVVDDTVILGIPDILHWPYDCPPSSVAQLLLRQAINNEKAT